MTWLVEAFRSADDGLEWEVELVDVDRTELEQSLCLPDLTIPASYPLSVEQAAVALQYAADPGTSQLRLDADHLEFFLSEVAD